MNLCKLEILNMGGPSSDPIRCANQNNEIKYPSRGTCHEGISEIKETFKSKYDSDMDLGYFMDYNVIQSISMSTIVVSVLSLELPIYKRYIFPNPLICLFICPLIIFASPLYKVSSHSITALGLG
jgi:hypothetical protein